MKKQLAGYAFLSFFSFCFFTVLFHTAVNTQIFASKSPPKQKIHEIATIPKQTFLVKHILKITTTPTPTPTNTPTPTDTPTPTPTFTPTPQPIIAVANDLEALFTKYSDAYHVNKDLLKKIGRCESGFNTEAANSIYVGIFQFAEQTWLSIRKTMGLDTNPNLRKNAEESIKTAAYMIAHGQQKAWLGCE